MTSPDIYFILICQIHIICTGTSCSRALFRLWNNEAFQNPAK